MGNQSLIRKFILALKGVPPSVKKEPKDIVGDYETEFSDEIFFSDYKTNEDDYKIIAYELFQLLEDIERAKELTKTNYDAFQKLSIDLVEKRHLYLSEEKVEKLRSHYIEEQERKGSDILGE